MANCPVGRERKQKARVVLCVAAAFAVIVKGMCQENRAYGSMVKVEDPDL